MRKPILESIDDANAQLTSINDANAELESIVTANDTLKKKENPQTTSSEPTSGAPTYSQSASPSVQDINSLSDVLSQATTDEKVEAKLSASDKRIALLQREAIKNFTEHPEVYATVDSRKAYLDSIAKKYMPFTDKDNKFSGEKYDEYLKVVNDLYKVDPQVEQKYKEEREKTTEAFMSSLNPLGGFTPAISSAAQSAYETTKGGIKKAAETKAVYDKEGFGSAALNALVGGGETVLGVAGAVVPVLAAFNIASKDIQENAPEVAEKLSPISTNLQKKYAEAGLPIPRWKENWAAIGDFGLWLLAGGVARKFSGKPTPEQVSKAIEEATPEQIKEAAAKVDEKYNPHPDESKIKAIEDDIAKNPDSPLNAVLQKEVDATHEKIATEQAAQAHSEATNNYLKETKSELEKAAELLSEESKKVVQPILDEVNSKIKTMADDLKVGDTVEMDVKPKESLKTHEEVVGSEKKPMQTPIEPWMIEKKKATQYEPANLPIKNGEEIVVDGEKYVSHENGNYFVNKSGGFDRTGAILQTYIIEDALKAGKYQQAIADGKMSAEQAKKIIESADLEVPKEISDEATKTETINRQQTPITAESTAEKPLENFTEAKVINRDYAILKEKLGEKKANKYFEQVDKLIDSNKNTVIEYRPAGVVVKEGDKYIFHALSDMDMKNWRVSFKKDITDQFSVAEAALKSEEKPLSEIEKSEIKENTAAGKTEGAQEIGIKNAAVDLQRMKRGLQPLISEASKSEEGVWNEALKKISEGFDPRTVEDKIIDENHIANETEVATMLHRQIDLNNKLRDAVDAKDKPAQARIEDEIDRNEQALRKTGTMTSGAFRIRQAIAKENYTLAHQESLLRHDLGGELSDKLKKRLAEYDKEHRQLQKELEELRASDDKKATAREQAKIERETKFEQRKSQRQDIKVKLKADTEKLVADVKEIFKKQRSTLSANPIPLEAAPKLAKIAKNYLLTEYKTFEQALDRVFTDLQNELDGLTKEHLREAILGVGDFKKEPKVKSAEELHKEAQIKRVQRKFDSEREKIRLKNRTPFEKVQDTFVNVERAFKLSGITTLAKLTSAAVTRSFSTRAEEVVGAGISKVLPKKLVEKAQREGGINIKAEAKAMTQGWMQGMKDSWSTLKEGKSDLDYLYGGKLEMPPEMVNFLGQLHGALKAVTKRAEFERSFEKRIARNINSGVDVNNPMVQAKIGMEAYKDANRAIFMQDNVLTDAYKALVNNLEQRGGGGKVAATTLKFLLPFVKVPTNIVGETFSYIGGTAKGSYLLIDAMRKGLDNVTPEQADIILRNFKKGSLGLGLLALGYYNSESFGGYYQKGDKREEGDVKAGAARIFGADIPNWLLHSPAFETIQLGATIHRLMDAHKGDKEMDMWEASTKSVLGLVEEVPFVQQIEEVSKLLDPQEFHYYLGELAKNTVDPIALQQIAKWMDDTEKRYPQTIKEHIEMGIPGLRENVPSSRYGGAAGSMTPQPIQSQPITK